MTIAAGARRVSVRGRVQGVGFRPFVYRTACRYGLTGWVVNTPDGVLIHAEGPSDALDRFIADLGSQQPPAARVAELTVAPDEPCGCAGFDIRANVEQRTPTVRVTPDLASCSDCVGESLDPAARRHGYPYTSCAACGPRFSIVLALPYDRGSTTMAAWTLCDACDREYRDPFDRRFHAQPIACPRCGPDYILRVGETAPVPGADGIRQAAALLAAGGILAVKGIGGYHLACDARNGAAVAALRARKFRKEQAFAVMARDLDEARALAVLSPEAVALLTGPERPILLAPSRTPLAGVAPDTADLGVMLPYAPIHHLLFTSGAPAALVLTSGNRSSEPIAYRDDDALERLGGVADAFLVGGRDIARRVDDSIVRQAARGPVILRRSRGYAPDAVATIVLDRPLLAVGADLKNALTLVVRGDAIVSQHIGDLAHYDAAQSLRQTAHDLVAMYGLAWSDMTVVHDAHPEYCSTAFALSTGASATFAVQHHQAHIASVLAEHGETETRAIGVAFDGTGYGDDGTIWGGEFFVGSLASGFTRVGHIVPAFLPGGDAAARAPVQAAAGFLHAIGGLPDAAGAPFAFPPRYDRAAELIGGNVRTFRTTSVGRLFDTVAALLGFTRDVSYEGQAAMWLEQLARRSAAAECLPFEVTADQIDWRPALSALIDRRHGGTSVEDLARAFHLGLGHATATLADQLCGRHGASTVVASGGVFQNQLLLDIVAGALPVGRRLLINHLVPPNDGGVSLGQAAIAAAVLRTRADRAPAR